MERWDLYDRDGRPTGRDWDRADPLPPGGYHLVCETLLRHTDGDYLLMLRDTAKRDYGGFYEATAGGSALKGETPLVCARRELLEETGLSAFAFEEVGFLIADEDQVLFHSYVATTDADKDSVQLQAGETIGYRWLNEAAFIAFLRSDEAIDRQVRRYSAWLRKKGYL